MNSGYYVNDDALDTFISGQLRHDADFWEMAGIRYDTYEHFEADLIAKLNEMFGSSFSSVEDLFVLKPAETEGERPTVEYSEALMEASLHLWEAWKEMEETAYNMDALAEHYALGGEPIAKIQTGWNQETQAMDYDYLPLTAYPWINIHGYAGSTAEAAAAASGVKFVPLCPVDASHNVTKKDAVAATCTEAGHTAGFYCEDCGAWMSGEATDPTGHLHQTVLDKVLPRRGYAEHGREAGVWCEDCNNPVSGCEVIHNQDGERTVIKEATETEEGEVIIVCTACGGEGLYALEKLEPDDGGSFLDGLRRMARSIIDFFLRLIKWLGGGK